MPPASALAKAKVKARGTLESRKTVLPEATKVPEVLGRHLGLVAPSTPTPVEKWRARGHSSIRNINSL